MMIRIFFLAALCLPGIIISAPSDYEYEYEEEYWSPEEPSIEDLYHDINVSEEEFEAEFGLDAPTDPEEKEKRQKALKASQQHVMEANKKYLSGDLEWFEGINMHSNLPEDEFIQARGGLSLNSSTDRLLNSLESERFFSAFRTEDRATVPASYNSVKLGNVSPVKNQGNCGSCVAFATMAQVETCFKRVVGKFGDYSEQHMVDCGYQYKSMINGCQGAAPEGYAQWLKEKKPKLYSETTYPYKATVGSCKTGLTAYNQGASVTSAYWTESGTETMLKNLVAKHGAVMTGVNAIPLQNYKGGIFSGCTAAQNQVKNHAVVVVGYGTEKGTDYWLIKNSWGNKWGEKGYFRVKRGAGGMCGVGSTLVTVSCAKNNGVTSAPVATTKTTAKTTTKKPSGACTDMFDFCAEVIEWDASICKLDEMFAADCKKSCKKC